MEVYLRYYLSFYFITYTIRKALQIMFCFAYDNQKSSLFVIPIVWLKLLNTIFMLKLLT